MTVAVAVPLEGGAEKSSSNEAPPETPVVGGPTGASPPRRSIAEGACLAGREVDALEFVAEAGLADADGALPSRTAGSEGGGPSLAHLRVSY